MKAINRSKLGAAPFLALCMIFTGITMITTPSAAATDNSDADYCHVHEWEPIYEGGKYICQTCGAWFDTGDEVLDHGLLEHGGSTYRTGKVLTHYECSTCGESSEDGSEYGIAHTWNEGVVAQEASCTEDGIIIYTCSNCGANKTELIAEATGHDYIREVTEAATCTAGGMCTYTCLNCGDRYTESIAAVGHSYTSEVTKAATCASAGTRTYTCSNCGDVYTESIPATEHSYDDGAVTAAATCTTAGTCTYTCSNCGSTYQESIPATGHSWDDGVVTTAATHTATGVKTYTCSVCGETKTETIAKLTFLFDDVQDSGEYYYDAVYWAYDNGITTGTSDTLFSPGDSCTRAQFVTFLWRLAGQPAPTSTSCQFTDLDTGEYYYSAVLWAVEQGVTNGTSAAAFSPSDKISRAQAVTMLYRYAGSPSVAGLSNSFTDVPTGEYYYNAVLWAVKNGITNGTSTTTFSPGDTCERAMMVTFLHRFAG